jgi:hypothetical protein
MASAAATAYIPLMCGRIIQSSGPLRYAIVDGMNVRDSRVHNYPPRWNAAPSQELLVIRRNHRSRIAQGAAKGAIVAPGAYVEMRSRIDSVLMRSSVRFQLCTGNTEGPGSYC